MKKSILLPVVTISLAALVLLGASWGLKGTAQANAQEEHLQILRTLLPGSTEFTPEPYAGEDANIRSVHRGENGFVIETVTNGYAGQISMLIGVSTKGTVTGLVVREMQETLGLGANALADHEFLAQFLNTQGDVAIGTSGGDTGKYVDAITGATVTSKAVARCVNSAVAYVTGADITSAATSWGG